MDASRVFAFSLAALLATAASLAISTPAQAGTRIRVYIGTPDVVIESGQPYYRADHSQLYVENDSYGQPRYYRYSDEPAVAVVSGPPAYGARANGEWRSHHRSHYYRHHHHHYWNHDGR
jgi:hypothetical protein